MASRRNTLELPPLTARSVLLSTLLGSHPPELPVRSLVRVGELFGIAEGTVRVALSRLAADGEVTATDGRYRLTGRLLERQRRQDESRLPPVRRWDGTWKLAIVLGGGRSRAQRASLRAALESMRFAALRDGAWTRPDNLVHEPPSDVVAHCRFFSGRFDDDDHELVASLWDVRHWASVAERLAERLASASAPAEQFTVAAAILRHLRSDPLLPDELVPDDWPGAMLRDAYDEFGERFRQLLTTA
jgi:phenylacetic acid degradation operon negative regulatory protein